MKVRSYTKNLKNSSSYKVGLSLYLRASGKREDVPYELCPNGFMAIWQHVQSWREERGIHNTGGGPLKFIDLGSGMGGAELFSY